MNRMELEWSRMITGWTKKDVKKYVPNNYGVYLIYYWNRSRWERFSMGQGNLWVSLTDFITEWKKNIFIQVQLSGCSCGFVFVEMEKQNDRERIVKYLYDSYKWKWIQNPLRLDLDPIMVTFPYFD